MKKLIVLFLGILFMGAACQKQATVSNSPTNTSQTANTFDTDGADPGTTNQSDSANTNKSTAGANVQWEWSGSVWQPSDTPPACPNPLVLRSPVNVALASSVLYPGQTRGGEYKPHGGFRFDSSADSDVIVEAPLDASVVNASRYIEAGEVQYLFTFVAPCGIMYRFDHLRTLSPILQDIADTLPEAKVDDSRTTQIDPPVVVKAGDLIASGVGFATSSNISVDFGLYDLRSKNAASQNASWAPAHQAELSHYAVCWLDLLPSSDAALVKALPAADTSAGNYSDYCL